tara:strand:+ start:131 stop:265 length:135 start_codon:yes stop_codon:yes gene_type:complete
MPSNQQSKEDHFGNEQSSQQSQFILRQKEVNDGGGQYDEDKGKL